MSDVVSSMVEWLLRGEEEKEKRWKRECLQTIQEAKQGESRALAVMGNARLPESLNPRVLSESERQAVSAACRDECDKYEQGEAVLRVVRVFVDFCELLAKPENHIKGRYALYGGLVRL